MNVPRSCIPIFWCARSEAALSARTKSMAGRPGRRARKQRAGEALATLAFGHANRTIKVTVGRRGKAHNMA